MIGDAMGAWSPKALDFELKRAVADRGGSGIGADAPDERACCQGGSDS